VPLLCSAFWSGVKALGLGFMGFGAKPQKKRVRDISRQAQNRRDLSVRFDGIVARDLSSVATMPMLASTLPLPL